MNKLHSYILGVFITTMLVGCNYFQPEDPRTPLARVNQNFLYQEDIKSMLPSDISSEDSAVFVNNYIKNWATEQLLLDQAKLNLPNQKQKEFDALVKDYRNELYTEAYKDLILSGKIDTVFQEEELQKYYEENTNNFKLNQDLLKFRYIYLNKKFPEFDKIKAQFTRFDKEDQIQLDKETLKFKAYSLNDSVWVSGRDFFRQLPILKDEESKDILKEDKFLQQADSLGVYLIKIEEVLLRNENAPFEYAKPTIKQILLNRKKIELSKDFEKEITKDALKNNKFEIYN